MLHNDKVALGRGLIADYVLDHQEASAIRGDVVRATEVGLAYSRVVVRLDQFGRRARPETSTAGWGVHGHSHQTAVRSPVEQFPTIPRPLGLLSTIGRYLPAAVVHSRKWADEDLELSGFIRLVCEPSAVG